MKCKFSNSSTNITKHKNYLWAVCHKRCLLANVLLADNCWICQWEKKNMLLCETEVKKDARQRRQERKKRDFFFFKVKLYVFKLDIGSIHNMLLNYSFFFLNDAHFWTGAEQPIVIVVNVWSHYRWGHQLLVKVMMLITFTQWILSFLLAL